MRLPEWLRRPLKSIANAVALLLVAPAGVVSWIETQCSSESELFFTLFAQTVALVPGYPGLCMRRAFYVLTLEDCSMDFFIGFGSLFTHRHARVEQSVYIGNFTLIGCANLRRGSLIGSHVSLLSGQWLHEPDAVAGWVPFDPTRLQQIDIGEQAWIGEHAVVMADLGTRAMAAAGSVISTSVPAGVMVAGNPARYVRRVHAEASGDSVAHVETVS